MGDRQPGQERDTVVQQRAPGFLRQPVNQWDQNDEADIEKHGNSNHKSGQAQRPLGLVFAEALQQGLCEAFSAAGHFEHLAEHRAQPDHDGHETERAAHALLNGFDDLGQWHAGGDAHQQTDQ